MACENCQCAECKPQRRLMQQRAAPFDPLSDVESFHRNFGLEYNGRPRVLPNELAEFRRKFIKEEYEEYSGHMYRASYWLNLNQPDRLPEHLEGMLDALVDLVYVALGNSVQHGFNFREAWRRVHEANMKKVRAQSAADSKRGTTYDVVKPPGWQAPSHADLVTNHAHINEDDHEP